LLSTGEITWFASVDPEWIRGWREGEKLQGGPFQVPDDKYLVYGPEQDSVSIRSEYLDRCLAISTVRDSSIFLLNPEVTLADGEWEAWYFSSLLPGAIRYRSFEELMIDTHRHCCEL
jgi:hypothetical protein